MTGIEETRTSLGPAGHGIETRERVRQILAAAVKVFGAGGPTAVTHRAVAAEARVSPGLTTYYFKDREDLLHRALQYAFAVESARLRACVAGVTGPLSVDRCVEVLTEMFFDKTVADPLYDSAKPRSAARAWARGVVDAHPRPHPSRPAARARARGVGWSATSRISACSSASSSLVRGSAVLARRWGGSALRTASPALQLGLPP